jgi:hypothetical protein
MGAPREIDKGSHILTFDGESLAKRGDPGPPLNQPPLVGVAT